MALTERQRMTLLADLVEVTLVTPGGAEPSLVERLVRPLVPGFASGAALYLRREGVTSLAALTASDETTERWLLEAGARRADRVAALDPPCFEEDGRLLIVPLAQASTTAGALLCRRAAPETFGVAEIPIAEALGRLLGLGLADAERRAESQRTLATMATAVDQLAHDLRNPLSVILMRAATLVESTERDVRFRRSAEAIQRSAELALELTRSLYRDRPEGAVNDPPARSER